MFHLFFEDSQKQTWNSLFHVHENLYYPTPTSTFSSDKVKKIFYLKLNIQIRHHFTQKTVYA